MKQYSVTTQITATPVIIWAILTDATHYPDWDPGVTNIEGQIALGQKITVHTNFSDQAFPVTVTEFVPHQHMTWAAGLPLGLFRGERTFTLTPQAEGITEFQMQEVFQGLLLPIIGRSIPDLNPIFAAFATALKRKAEGNRDLSESQ